MNTFIKTYNVEPNQLQRDAMKRALKVQVEYCLSIGESVEVITDKFDNKIIVNVLINNVFNNSILIGARGGISLV